MNTREREVIGGAIAMALRHGRLCAPDVKLDGGLEQALRILAEGRASSGGAEAVAFRAIRAEGRTVDAQGCYYPIREPIAQWLLDGIARCGGRVEYVYAQPQPTQGEHEQRSCEASERRPIADEVVERACKAAFEAPRANIDDPRTWEEYAKEWPDMASEIRSAQRAALESALPRGLPAGSDAKEDSR